MESPPPVATLIVIWIAGILAAQPSPPPEVRASSRPYIPAPYVLRVQTDLVETGVVVRDRRGRPVGGLTADDFKIFDDGNAREIAGFSVETAFANAVLPAPGQPRPAAPSDARMKTAAPPGARIRYVALLFDDVNTSQGDLGHAREAAGRFLGEAALPGDRVGIFTTSETSSTPFSRDTAAPMRAIQELRAHPRMDANGIAPCPRITPYQAYLIVSLDLTALQSALDEAHLCADSSEPGMGKRLSSALVPSDITAQMVRVQAEQTWDQARTVSQVTLDAIDRVVGELGKMPGERIVLLASAGFLAGTLDAAQNRIVDHALAARVVINALDAKGLFSGATARTPDQLQYLQALPATTQMFEAGTRLSRLETANSPLINLAGSTGGSFFHNSNDLAQGFQELAAVPAVVYRLGFRPYEGNVGRLHRLQVKLAKPGSYTVQARPGYFALPQAPGPATAADMRRRRLDREVLASDEPAEFPASVTVATAKPGGGHRLVWISVHVDLRHLTFTNRDARRVQGLTFVSALIDGQGTIVAAKEGRMDLDLSGTTFARLEETGLNARLSIEAPPAGPYRLREVVQEDVDGKLAASKWMVEIPE